MEEKAPLEDHVNYVIIPGRAKKSVLQGRLTFLNRRCEEVKKAELKKFKNILEEQRQRLVGTALKVKDDNLQMSRDDMPDDVDLATSEINQSVLVRLRDRERLLLQKIERALQKIEDGTFGICESCGDPISVERLEARPVTSLCISCKEEQEYQEKIYA